MANGIMVTVLEGYLTRIASFFLGHPLVAAVTFCLAFALAVLGAFNLDTRLQRADFLPLGARATTGPLAPSDERAILRAFDVSERLVVYFASDDSLDLDEVGMRIDRIVGRVEQVEGVRSVRASGRADQVAEASSLPGGIARFLTTHELTLIGERLSWESVSSVAADIENGSARFPERDPLGVAAVVQSALHRLVGNAPIREVDGHLISRDGRLAFILIDLNVQPDDIDGTGDIVRAIASIADASQDELRASFPDAGLRVGLVGRPASYLSASETLSGDIRRTGFAAVLAVSLVLLVIFRSPVAPALILASVVFGVCAAIALVSLMWESVSTMSLIFVGAVIGLGVDFGLHVAVNFYSEGSSTSAGDRASLAVSHTGRAIVFCCLTSSVAFGSLATMSYPVTQQVAALAAIGLVAVAAAALFALPAGLSRLGSQGHGPHHVGRWPARLSTRGVWLWLFVPVAALLVLPRVAFEPHPWSLAVRGNPKTVEMEQLRAQVGAAFTPVLLVSVGSTADSALARDRQSLDQLRPGWQRAGIVAVESPSTWSPPSEQRQTNQAILKDSPGTFGRSQFVERYERALSGRTRARTILTTAYRDSIASFLPDFANATVLAEQLRTAASAAAHDDVSGLLELSDGFAAVSHLYLRDFPWAEGTVARLVDTCEKSGACQEGGSVLMGSAVMSSSHAMTLVADLKRALILSAVLVVAFLLAQGRSIPMAVAALLPVLCGLSATVIVMGVTGIELNMLTLSVYPLIIGLGIDDGIHIVEQFRRGAGRVAVLARTGPALFATTITSVVAFACLGLADFVGVRDMGVLAAAGLTVSMLAALHLLPAVVPRLLPQPEKTAA